VENKITICVLITSESTILNPSKENNSNEENQKRKNKMKIQDKINSEAFRIAQAYIRVLKENNNPAKLDDQINYSKYAIMCEMNDRRLNVIATLNKIKSAAKEMIQFALNDDIYLMQNFLRIRSLIDLPHPRIFIHRSI
jgi:hypothetical protein